MGGAERNERKRRQTQRGSASAVSKTRAGASGKQTWAAVIGVVVLAVVVIGGVLFINSSKDATGPIPALSASLAEGVTEQRDNAVVVSGKPDAPVEIDIYADFLCPGCGSFQQIYGPQLEEKINAGQLKVRHHMLPFLVKLTNPEGYSLNAANASLCAADGGKFTAYHNSLFAAQPAEGGSGYSKEQLIQLGKDLGIPEPAFSSCVNGGTYDQALLSHFEQVSKDPMFEGTPTVVAKGQKIDPRDPEWVNKLFAGN